MSLLSLAHLQDEAAAYAWVEAHLWPNGPVCPHCGETARVGKMQGKATRAGLHKCYACRKQFRVTVGTIFEHSKIPMHKWLQAFYLVAGSKKGISANQLHRTLGITLKSAWFVGHRIREAMRTGTLAAPLGGDNGNGSGIVEADETYFGKVENPLETRTDGTPFKKGGRRGPANKRAILSLVERGGSVRSFHIARADKETVTKIVNENVAKEAMLVTDESRLYGDTAIEDHQTVHHARGEYARGIVHSNTIESYFSVFKRGMKGVYQHCSEKHLHRYLAEFDFRYNHRVALDIHDDERPSRMVEGAKGKRLTYRTTGTRAE
jgi:transposase-like protein